MVLHPLTSPVEEMRSLLLHSKGLLQLYSKGLQLHSKGLLQLLHQALLHLWQHLSHQVLLLQSLKLWHQVLQCLQSLQLWHLQRLQSLQLWHLERLQSPGRLLHLQQLLHQVLQHLCGMAAANAADQRRAARCAENGPPLVRVATTGLVTE